MDWTVRATGGRVALIAFALLAYSMDSRAATLPPAAARTVGFEKDIQPIFAKNCYACHGPKKQKGGYRLDRKAAALGMGADERPIIPGKSAESPLIRRVAGLKADEAMPPEGEPLSSEQIGLLRAWIDRGAQWPEKDGAENPLDWWSLRPLARPAVPALAEADRKFARTPVDAFILAKLREKKLAPSPEADRRTLIRRLYFDLTGLPPSPEDVAAFEADGGTGFQPDNKHGQDARATAGDAYEKLVDRLLASPRYGERWARHWMDAVHFGETHGHDQDRVRPNAWPYRDYLIAAFNNDTPYARFIQEQLAADVLFPDEPHQTPALGFIAAGPWDESSLRDIREDSTCRKVGYYLDRDDMVAQTMSAFTSSTVHCARCHDHKFDPISQADYYSLQAVFAGLGRADRAYDADPRVHKQRRELQARIKALDERKAKEIESQLQAPSGTAFQAANERGQDARATVRAEFQQWLAAQRAGARQDPEWTLLAIPDSVSKENVRLLKQADGSLLAAGLTPESDTYTLVSTTTLNSITGVRLEILPDKSLPHNGPGRQPDNGNLHLSEFQVYAAPAASGSAFQAEKENGQDARATQPAEKKRVAIARAAADFNQAGWTIAHAIDGKMETAWGIFPETGKAHAAVFEFKEPLRFEGGAGVPARELSGTVLTIVLEQQHGRKHLIGRLRLSVTRSPQPAGKTELPEKLAKLLLLTDDALTAEQRLDMAAFFLKGKWEQQLAALPAPSLVYAGARDFKADGTHRPLSAPRPVNVLRRGELQKPGELARPGALSCVPALKARFELAETNDEGQRRAALALWISDPANPLAWRSIVNRVWHYHFGRGLANMPNDFGRMGSSPTHPELLDWLAAEFQANGGSLKKLHRLIVTSAVYRQSSAVPPASRRSVLPTGWKPVPRTGETPAVHAEIDADNVYLWRMNRTRLDAESVRDAILQVSGRLDLAMGGPSVQHFKMTPGVHVTPGVDYTKYDWNAPGSGRRSVYRFVFRTLPDPFMDALDGADASQLTAARNASVTPLQALALLNDAFVLRHSEILAEKIKGAGDAKAQIKALCLLVFLRTPTDRELQQLEPFVARHGLENLCRVVLNSSEFLFVD